MTFPRVCPVADDTEWLPDRLIGGSMASTRGLVLHVNQGNGDPAGWWEQPTTPTASSHFQLMKSGQLIQYVPLDTVAWCQVAGSTTWHSIETEGFDYEALTQPQVDKLTALYHWGAAALGWPLQLADSPDGTGLGTHAMGGEAWGGHPCPGDLRSAQRAGIIAGAQNLGNYVAIPLPTITGSDHTHPRSLQLLKTLLLAINPKTDVSTDAATVAAVIGHQTFFHVAGGADGRVGQATWASLLYLGTGAAH